MPKHEKGTPKEIANRWKTKGLQKLRWFCEMCQKQCRDENGFKCHLTSESHQRQLLLFAETPDKYISQYSQEFEQNFVRVLRTGYGTRRVRANEVYQEYIKDKMHVHMNSTQWTTLTQFVQWLGNKKKCKIDLNEKGWYIQYIDYEEEARKEEEAKREKQELDDEQKQLDQIEAQVQRARALHGEQEYADATELVRNDDEKITIDLGVNKKPDIEELNRAQPMLGVSVFDRAKVKKEDDTERSGHHLSKRRSRSRSRSSERQSSRRKRDFRQRDEARKPSSSRDEKLKKSALDEIREMEERRKEKKNRKDYWMHTGIVIKVITRKLGDDYYKRKGVVKELIDEYTAKVAIDDVTVKLDQSHVETVVPQVGREMLIVNGAYRGTKATLQRINVNDFSVILRLSEGLCKGREVTLPYEDASKLA